MSISGWFW